MNFFLILLSLVLQAYDMFLKIKSNTLYIKIDKSCKSEMKIKIKKNVTLNVYFLSVM